MLGLTRVWRFETVGHWILFPSRRLMIAVVWASVAASLIVQQVGLPVVTKRDSGSEMWNGASVHGRVEDLIGRT